MPVVLYDLPSKDPCRCWSLNPWKARLALNFKGIDYETKWLEYPDVAPTLKSLGVAPNTEGMAYTIPTASIDGKIIMDSWNIAQALEVRNPSPSLHLDDPMFKRVTDIALPIIGYLRPVFMPLVPPRVLNEESKPYFYDTRAKRFGMPLDQWGSQFDLEKEWEHIAGELKKVAELLKENPGPYFLGHTASYADFFVVSFVHFCKRLDEALFSRIIAVDKSFGDLYQACEKWLERDDH